MSTDTLEKLDAEGKKTLAMAMVCQARIEAGLPLPQELTIQQLAKESAWNLAQALSRKLEECHSIPQGARGQMKNALAQFFTAGHPYLYAEGTTK